MQFCRRAVDTHDEQPNWPFCSPRILRHKIIRSLLLQVRTAILGMLDAWVTVVPVERVLPSVADAIAAPKASSEGKLTGLKWLATVLDHGRASKGLAAVLRSATLGMNDKASDVREAGTTLMTLMLEVRSTHSGLLYAGHALHCQVVYVGMAHSHSAATIIQIADWQRHKPTRCLLHLLHPVLLL